MNTDFAIGYGLLSMLARGAGIGLVSRFPSLSRLVSLDKFTPFVGSYETYNE